MVHDPFKGSFQKKTKNDETYEKFYILGGGLARDHFAYVITILLKCIKKPFLAILDTLFFSLMTPPPPSTTTLLAELSKNYVWYF